MAFLDNSGDIILDAVLTDTGRLRLAQGDGSFKISKFALADDEINYGLYNSSHSSGSAYYDLEVLQLPILEAFTNNTSNMKSKLVSFSRTNILYMPILKLNKQLKVGGTGVQNGVSSHYHRKASSVGNVGDNLDTFDGDRFYVAVDQQTYSSISWYRGSSATADGGVDDGTEIFGSETYLHGLIQGYLNPGTTTGTKIDWMHASFIRVDQGLDTNEISPAVGLDSDMAETAYIIEMDYRLGRLKENATDKLASVNFIDDDNIASYYVTSGGNFVNPSGANFVSKPANPLGFTNGSATDQSSTVLAAAGDPQVFEGPRGSVLAFRPHASLELQQSTYLFEQLGFSEDLSNGSSILGLDPDDHFTDDKTAYYLDTTVRITGANTGYILDIPIRYVKIK